MNTTMFGYGHHNFVEAEFYSTKRFEGVLCTPYQCMTCRTLIYVNTSTFKPRYFDVDGNLINGKDGGFPACVLDHPVDLKF